MECFCFAPWTVIKELEWNGTFFSYAPHGIAGFQAGQGAGPISGATYCSQLPPSVSACELDASCKHQPDHWQTTVSRDKAKAVNHPAAPRHNRNEISWPLTSVVFAVLFQCFHSSLGAHFVSSLEVWLPLNFILMDDIKSRRIFSTLTFDNETKQETLNLTACFGRQRG